MPLNNDNQVLKWANIKPTDWDLLYYLQLFLKLCNDINTCILFTFPFADFIISFLFERKSTQS